MLEERILNEFQRDLPLTAQPYTEIAHKLGCDEKTVLEVLTKLKNEGTISRVGAIFPPGVIGKSTLAAMAVPPENIEEIAQIVSNHEGVNHNYEREHKYNLWFVVTAFTQEKVQKILQELSEQTGMAVLDLPMLKSHHIDLGFPLK